MIATVSNGWLTIPTLHPPQDPHGSENLALTSFNWSNQPARKLTSATIAGNRKHHQRAPYPFLFQQLHIQIVSISGSNVLFKS